MPLTGLVLLALGAVYEYTYRTSDQAKRDNTNTTVARYARILFPVAGMILLLVWVIREIF